MQYSLPIHAQFERGTLTMRAAERVGFLDQRIPGQRQRRGLNRRDLFRRNVRANEQARDFDVQKIDQFELNS